MSQKQKIKIRRLVLDILKPYEPELHIVASNLVERYSNVEGVNITVYEMDQLVQKVKMIIEGKNLDYDDIEEYIKTFNCVVHSLDQVVAGERLVEDVDTPQD
jgi:hypothetical protein